MPLRYSFHVRRNSTTAVFNASTNVTDYTQHNSSSEITLISGSLLPQHIIRMPVGPAPEREVHLVLHVHDANGAVAEHTGCTAVSSAASPQASPCKFVVTSPATGTAAVLAAVGGKFGLAALQSSAAAQRLDESCGIAGSMLSLLNSLSLAPPSDAARRLLTTPNEPWQEIRALRASITDSLTAQLTPEQTGLLDTDRQVMVARVLSSIAAFPKQVSPAAQAKLVAASTAIASGGLCGSRPQGWRCTTPQQDLMTLLSRLRRSVAYSRVQVAEVGADAALQQQDAIEEAISVVARRGIQTPAVGRPSTATPRVLMTPEFATYAVALSVARGVAGVGGTLKSKRTVQLGGYADWVGESEVTLAVPDIALEVAADKGGSAAELVATVWRESAALVRGALDGTDGTLLGQYVSVAFHWHWREGGAGEVNVTSLDPPLRIGLQAKIPNRTELRDGIKRVPASDLSGRQGHMAVCAYRKEAASFSWTTRSPLAPIATAPNVTQTSTWGVDGMSFALNESSVSPYVSQASVPAQWLDGAGVSRSRTGGSRQQVVCEASHLTSFSVHAEEVGCDGVPRSALVLDRCNVCGGNNTCVDCADEPFGGRTIDPCGLCNNQTHQNTLASCLGCDGVIYPPFRARANDVCNVCGGNGNHRGCDGTCNSALALDECGTPCLCHICIFERAHVPACCPDSLFACQLHPASHSALACGPCFLRLCF